MSDDAFEFTSDPVKARAASGAPRQVCAVKVQALMTAANFARKLATAGDREAGRIVAVLDQAEIGPDFDPSPIATQHSAFAATSSLPQAANAGSYL